MKKIILTGSVVMLAIALVTGLYSCQKEKTTSSSTPADDTAVQNQNASDDVRVSSELDNATSDEVAAMSSTSTMSGRMSSAGTGVPLSCDATVDSTNISSGVIVITFDSVNSCTPLSPFHRSGSITLNIINYAAGMRWTTPGATVGITFNNYRVYRGASMNYIMFNGSKSLTNVNGGLFKNITTSFSLVHKLTANINVTFSHGGKAFSWNVARTTTWSSPSASVYQVTVTGNGTAGGYSNVSMWGTNRAGNSFYEVFATPYSANSNCLWWRPTAGVIALHGLAHDLTITYGVDAFGSPAAASTCSAFGFSLSWTNPAGISKTAVIPYF